MSASLKLPADALSAQIDLTSIAGSSATNDDPLLPAQNRAKSALEFGLQMTTPGYHIFVMAEPEWGRYSLAEEYVERFAQTLPVPNAILYVENFQRPNQPLLITASAEQCRAFYQDMQVFVEELAMLLPRLTDAPLYQFQQTARKQAFREKMVTAIKSVEARAENLGCKLVQDADFSFRITRLDQLPAEAELPALSLGAESIITTHVAELENCLAQGLAELPRWQLDLAKNLKQLIFDSIQTAIEPTISGLIDKYRSINDLVRYLDAVKDDLSKWGSEYLSRYVDPKNNNTNHELKDLLTERYLPNRLVERASAGYAPVVYEPNPTLQNLFGTVEYASKQGGVSANFQNIRSGALHEANGGFLLLDAEKLLIFPEVWDALKTMLQTGVIKLDAGYGSSAAGAKHLHPQAVPANLKIILLGTEDDYYLLDEWDNAFINHFKVLADFDYAIDLNQENLGQFVRLVQHQAVALSGQPLTLPALSELVKQSCRQAGHQDELSANIQDLLDLVAEAHFFSGQANGSQIQQCHIEQALSARERRNGKLLKLILDDMLDGAVLIDSAGEAVGKINGLTIIEMGGSSFGAPARITATVYPGSRGIVDIEREAELGQSIHSKGVMILTGYLGHCYAQQFPLAISASIALEQSYGFIDGDSASLAELCCLISALTRSPIQQGIAVTGSINQYGEVQAVGGINEKIEGFFRLCQARGLDGRQGVILPLANQRNLMLKKEVIAAVEQGLFSIYAVATVDQALELLTGQSAGTVDKEGYFPAESLNAKAISRLKEISDLALDEDKEES